MHARYRTDGTRHLLHLSIAPFTETLAAGEADAVIADVALMPGPLNQCRLSSDLTTVELDPALAGPVWAYDSAQSARVKTAADANRITAARIVDLHGGVDGEAKRVRLMLRSMWILTHDTWPDEKTPITWAEKLEARVYLGEQFAVDTVVEGYVAQGKAFKQQNGLV